MPASRIHTETVDVAGAPAFVRRTHGDGHPALFVHGNPTSSADWIPFLEAYDGPGIALDLPAFGRTPRPPGFSAAMEDYAEWVDLALEALGIERFSLVVHDWGSIGLVAAQRRAASIERLTVIDAVPLAAEYRWHWLARVWRTPVVGEVVCATNTRFVTDLLLQSATGDHRRAPRSLVDAAWRNWRPEMWRSVLALYRSADPGRLEAAGARLGEIRCPALVVWGRADPYVGPENAQRYADALGGPTEVEVVPRAGHWPWLDRPELVGRVASWLSAGRTGPEEPG